MATKFPFKKFLVEFFTKTFPAVLISALLFLGGIILLFLKIPGWSLFLGLPAVQIGIVLLIFTFEAVGRRKSVLPSQEYHLVNCLTCGQQTIAPRYIQKRICDNCQIKIAQNLKRGLLVIYLIFTTSLTVNLVAQNQNLRERALEPTPFCDPGSWNPPECRCGVWQEDRCPPNEKTRHCQGKTFCCLEEKNQVWDCLPAEN